MHNKEMIAYCGLICSTCPIHIATIETDEQKRLFIKRQVVEELKHKYNQELSPEEVNDCDGCITDSSRIYLSCKTCKIRNCAKQKEVTNCAFCNVYPCQKLNEVFNLEENARNRLDQIRQKVKKAKL